MFSKGFFLGVVRSWDCVVKSYVITLYKYFDAYLLLLWLIVINLWKFDVKYYLLLQKKNYKTSLFHNDIGEAHKNRVMTIIPPFLETAENRKIIKLQVPNYR